MTAEIERCLCNTCAGATAHDVVHIAAKQITYPDGTIGNVKIAALSCRGCQDAAIRENISKSDGTTEIRYKPPRFWAYKPKWIADLEAIDPNIHDILLEVYSAANEHQFRLFAMGVRTALDHVMTLIVGDGFFKEKLKKMVSNKQISEKQKEMLETVIDCGSAAAHRGFKPPVDLLNQMIASTENIIRDHYITDPMLKTLKTNIPPKPGA